MFFITNEYLKIIVRNSHVLYDSNLYTVKLQLTKATNLGDSSYPMCLNFIRILGFFLAANKRRQIQSILLKNQAYIKLFSFSF